MTWSVVIVLFSQMGAPLRRVFPQWQVLPVLQRAKEGRRCWGSDRNGQRLSTKCFHSDAHGITALLLHPTVGVLSKTLSWRALGFYHKQAPPQRGDAPHAALQQGPGARLGGRLPTAHGAFVLPRHPFTCARVAVVRDSSVLQSGRFIWLDGSSWSYADWLPGRPNASSNVDNCVEVLGESHRYFPRFFSWCFQQECCTFLLFEWCPFSNLQQTESLTTKGVVKQRPSSAPTQNNCHHTQDQSLCRFCTMSLELTL